MNRRKEALFHDGTQRFLRYDEEKGIYTFVLRTAAGEVNEAFLCIRNTEMRMCCEKHEGSFDYFSVSLALPEKLVRYHFKVADSRKILFYDASGASEYCSYEWEFEFTPGFTTPDWAKGAVMYQIMVDRFCNGDKSNDVVNDEYIYIGRGVSHVDNWSEPSAVDGTRQFYGGDFQGVIDKLDYLSKLGIEVIYFNPIFVSPSNHKYDIQDYDFVDPHFGKIVNDGGGTVAHYASNNFSADKYKIRTTDLENLAESNKLFIKLVKKAHEKGIKVIIDGVFNHCGSFNKWMDREGIYLSLIHI